jgi:hypothetical protein
MSSPGFGGWSVTGASTPDRIWILTHRGRRRNSGFLRCDVPPWAMTCGGDGIPREFVHPRAAPHHFGVMTVLGRALSGAPHCRVPQQISLAPTSVGAHRCVFREGIGWRDQSHRAFRSSTSPLCTTSPSAAAELRRITTGKNLVYRNLAAGDLRRARPGKFDECRHSARRCFVGTAIDRRSQPSSCGEDQKPCGSSLDIVS